MSLVLSLAERAARINAAHLAASGAAVSALEHARVAGEHLVAAKSELVHGEWLPWLASNFEGSRETAANYMRIANRWAELNVASVPHLTVRAAIASLAGEARGNSIDDRVSAAVDRSAAALKEQLAANDGWVDDGSGSMVRVEDLPEREQDVVLRSALAEETYERMQRQSEHIRAHYDNHDAQGKVIDPAKAYYDFLSKQGCVRCGSRPVEVAHVRMIISPKTGLLMPRSHKGLARWGCVPLCTDCHRTAADSIHAIGEEAFNESIGRGQHFLFQAAVSLMAEFMEGGWK